MCNCSKASGSKWLVKYPDGRTEEQASAASARMAAARVRGATVQKVA